MKGEAAAPFDAKKRRRIIDEILRTQGREGLVPDYKKAFLDYLSGVPRIALSRCPFTKTEVVHSVDTFGIDGPWWDHDAALRPREHLPPTFLVLTGAMSLIPPVESTASLVTPGPEVPFVVPRMLKAPNTAAVISKIKVGNHDAYPIVYFAKAKPPPRPWFNTWGLPVYWFEHEEEGESWDRVFADYEEVDFDLAPWIQQKRLYWIAPGDSQLNLRSEVEGCPYLGLQGRRKFLRVHFGQVWEPELEPRS